MGSSSETHTAVVGSLGAGQQAPRNSGRVWGSSRLFCAYGECDEERDVFWALK